MILTERAVAFFRTGQARRGYSALDEAEKIYQELGAKPDYFALAVFDFWRARIAQSQSRNEKSLSYLNKFLPIMDKRYPNDQFTMIGHSLAIKQLEKLGRRDEASKHSRQIASVRPGTLDQALKPIYRVYPTYPIAEAKLRREGYVIVRFDVDDAGFVENIEVVEVKGSKMFVKSSIEALKQYRYIPAFKDGKPAPLKGLMYKFVFNLD